jgi:N-acetylmuramoyl-L-alanine amidase
VAAALLATVARWPDRVVVLAQAPAGTQLSVYSRQATYNAPILSFNGQSYLGLVELLEPLGTVEGRVDGKKYRLKFATPGAREIELQFQDGKEKGKIKGDGIKLPANFVLDGGRGYVPMTAVSEVLSRTLTTPIRFSPAARRLFIGEVGVGFTLDLRSGNPSKLFISFTAPVNPTIATEPGHIRFTFRRDPVLPAVDHVAYTDALITGASFSEHDGIGELDVTGTASLMANFADGNKTIVVSATPPPPPPPTPVQPAPTPAAPAPTPEAAPLKPVPSGPRFLVLIDPAHGGTDLGAAITKDIAEKDLVLNLARRLQRELENRGIPASLLRNSDIAISLDQRAVSADAARPAFYVVLHAANTGTGVHVFTSLTDSNNPTTQNFLPWETAQGGYVEASSSVAAAVMAELVSRKLPNTLLTAPLRPMNNITAPAIAIEIASPSDNVADIAKPAYLEQVAQSIAAGILASRNAGREAHP